MQINGHFAASVLEFIGQLVPSEALYLCSLEIVVKLLEQFCELSALRVINRELFEVFNSGGSENCLYSLQP